MTTNVTNNALATLLKALAWLATAAEDLDTAIDGVTEEFEPERAELNVACNNARALIAKVNTLRDTTLAPSEMIDLEAEPDIDELLREKREIAHIWSIEDVQEVRPDLTGDQAWEVLQNVDRCKDASMGISWETLEIVAQKLFGDEPDTDGGQP